jgi:hypothetical protein
MLLHCVLTLQMSFWRRWSWRTTSRLIKNVRARHVDASVDAISVVYFCWINSAWTFQVPCKILQVYTIVFVALLSWVATWTLHRTDHVAWFFGINIQMFYTPAILLGKTRVNRCLCPKRYSNVIFSSTYQFCLKTYSGYSKISRSSCSHYEHVLGSLS